MPWVGGTLYAVHAPDQVAVGRTITAWQWSPDCRDATLTLDDGSRLIVGETGPRLYLGSELRERNSS